VLSVDDPAAVARTTRLQAALGTQIRPVAPSDLHVTVWVAGFPVDVARHDDDVSTEVIDATVASLRAAPPLAPRLLLGGANAFRSCAFLEIRDPEGGLGALRARFRGDLSEVRFGPYRPHITAGRFPSALATADVAARLTPLRELPGLPLRARALRFVTFDARVADAPLEVVHRIDLPEAP